MSIIISIRNPERVAASQQTRRSNAAGVHRDTVPKSQIQHQEIAQYLDEMDVPAEMLRYTKF